MHYALCTMAIKSCNSVDDILTFPQFVPNLLVLENENDVIMGFMVFVGLWVWD